MQTLVQRDGAKRYIIHEGISYTDTLRSMLHMRSNEDYLYQLHDREFRLSSDPLMREWHAKLRNNACARLQRWA